MAVITPNTDLYLLKVPLEINDINQLTFASKEAQFNYFNSLPKLEVEEYTYQRKDGTIRFSGNFDELLTYNYVMYRNTEYSDKWFYAYIINMEYLNDSVTAISIKTDVYQTWCFDLIYKPCMIEREHTNDDTVGNNTLPEQLELGEIVANGNTINFGLSQNDVKSFLVIADVTMVANSGTNQTLTYSWSDGTTTMPASYVNGIPSGCYHIIVGEGSVYSSPDIGNFISVYEKAGLSDAITSVYVLPKNIINNNDYKTGLTISTTGVAPSATAPDLSLITSSGISPTWMSTFNGVTPTSLNGYTPKNKKLLTYPYCYFNISNNAGSSVPFHYEDFNDSRIPKHFSFRIEGVCCQGGSVKAIPQEYKNINDDSQFDTSHGNAYDYSITAAKYPICSWISDSYTNWLTQNAVNMQNQWKTTLLSSGTEIIGGAIAGGAGGLLLGGIATGKSLFSLAREQMLAKTQANLVPDQAQGNVNVGDLVFSKLGCQFTYLPMSIKAEYARCIDDYLSEFGYSTNRVKLPNITGRRNWNYVKTVGCYIEADIPQEDLAEIKSMFDRGVTFWHNPATFADYSQNNDII